MTYVPIVVPPTTPEPPSPRTRELAGLLTKVLQEYQKAHPSVTAREVRAALRLAQASTGKGNSPVVLGLAAGLGLLVALGVMLLLFVGRSGGVELGGSMPMIVIALMIFLGIVVAVLKVASK